MNENLSSRDQKIIWHPFTQHKSSLLPIPIVRAEGSYLFDEKNNKYLDLISSWWVNLHGHGHPDISKAIYEQANKLDHVLFAGCTHEPAVKLAENLKKILPSCLSRFFYSDNGSTATEIALKISYQYWLNQGYNKPLFLCFDGSYHGDTFGAMSVGSNSGFHDNFKKLFFKTLSLPYPATYDGDVHVEINEAESFTKLELYLSENKDKIAAFILEPIVQGASGMRCARIEFLNKILNIVRQHNILIIFDEVMTGFCRLGTYFACNQLTVQPDLICVSKGISGGFLPLALTITSEEIFKQFLNDQWKYAFSHGHSYTANPIACAAGIASYNLLVSDHTQQSIANINKAHLDGCELIKNKISKCRIKGTIAAFEANITIMQQEKFINSGLLLRPLGNVIYLMPPYSTTYNELINAYEIIDLLLNNP